MKRDTPIDAVVVLALALTMASPAAAQGPQAREEAVLRKLVADQIDAWNRHDAIAWSKDFAVDAEFINVLGNVLTGKAAIEHRQAFLFEGPFKESRVMVMVRRIIFPASDVAVVDMNFEVTGHNPLPGVAPTDNSGVLRTRMKYILKKTRARWQIVAAQDTDVKPVMGAAQPSVTPR